MRYLLQKLCTIFISIYCITSFAQVKEAGPIIKDYGKVWSIENPEYQTDSEKEFKAVFDVMTSPESHDMVNPAIETVARFLNMHARAGIEPNNLKAALIIHNKASKDIMTHEAYLKRYSAENPNLELLNQLMNAGVEVIFCGQSSLSREIPRDQLIRGVQTSLSAMTALIQLQDEGYRLIKF